MKTNIQLPKFEGVVKKNKEIQELTTVLTFNELFILGFIQRLNLEGLSIRQTDIATYMCLSRERVNKIISSMEQFGIITIQKGIPNRYEINFKKVYEMVGTYEDFNTIIEDEVCYISKEVNPLLDLEDIGVIFLKQLFDMLAIDYEIDNASLGRVIFTLPY